jgi:alcohol dehydrogenase YqhD (iron-dependent ADH family)
MDNFVFQNPTKIIFGRDIEKGIGREVSVYAKKALLHYGGGSIKKSGLYGKITASLKENGVSYMELSGVKPNPRLSLVQEGIDLCRKNGISFILAVGGGSVIDSAKAIAIGVPYDGDVWDFYSGKAEPKSVLPLGTVLTIPAAGSEMSRGSVITKEEGLLKRPCDSALLYPKFSFLNPENAFTLPDYQVACGASDIIAHLMERYFTNTKHVELIDRMIEAAIKTVIHNAPKILVKKDDYNAWAEMMWAGTVAHNDLLSTGRETDWGSHNIEHELSGIYDIAHGAGLSIVFPAWMRYVYRHDTARFMQFAVRVFNVDQNFFDPEETALEGIGRLKAFFKSIGLPVSLKDAGIGGDRLKEMAMKATDGGEGTLGSFVELKTQDIYNILESAL